MNKTITVSFTTDKEAGVVYGALRHLKREGYTQSYTMYDDCATLSVDAADVDTVLNVFNGLAGLEMPGISAQID